MSHSKQVLRPMDAPVDRAMVFICGKCGKRAGKEKKHAGHKLASRFKRLAKQELGKGQIRVVLTSCMDACPEDRISVSLQPVAPGAAPTFFEADLHDIDGSSESLLEVVAAIAPIRSVSRGSD